MFLSEKISFSWSDEDNGANVRVKISFPSVKICGRVETSYEQVRIKSRSDVFMGWVRPGVG